MRWNLHDMLSDLLLTYYRGPDHPCKLRLINIGLRALSYPLISRRYAGGRIYLDLREFVDLEIFKHGAYEPEVWTAINDQLVEDEVLWDIGAHIGGISLLAAADPRVAVVHAFEPNRRTFRRLEANIARNRLPIVPHCIGLAAEKGEWCLIEGPPGNSGGTSLGLNAASERVSCESIDNLVTHGSLPKPTVVKIDVEGLEREVVSGAIRTIADSPPKAILVETACADENECGNSDVGRLLVEHGYKIHHIQRPNGSRDKVENFIAVRP